MLPNEEYDLGRMAAHLMHSDDRINITVAQLQAAMLAVHEHEQLSEDECVKLLVLNRSNPGVPRYPRYVLRVDIFNNETNRVELLGHFNRRGNRTKP